MGSIARGSRDPMEPQPVTGSASVRKRHFSRGVTGCVRVVAVSAACAIIGLVPSVTGAARVPSGLRIASRSVVSTPVNLIGCPPKSNENTPQVSADPSDPDRIVVSYTVGDAEAEVVAVSNDRGSTWTRTLLRGLTRCSGNPDGGQVLDPFLAVGPDGRIYVTTSWGNFDAPPGTLGHDGGRAYLSVSSDGGATFRRPVEPDPGKVDQRDPMVADQSHPGRVHVFFERVFFLSPLGFVPGPGSLVGIVDSNDGGRTFGPPRTVASGAPGHDVLTAGSAQSGGSLIVVRADINDTDIVKILPTLIGGPALGPTVEKLIAKSSTDGGKTWSNDASVGTYSFFGDSDPGGCCIPDLAATSDGDAYEVWADRVGSGGRVIVSRSTDGGHTWRLKTAVTTAGRAFLASVAARPDGHVAVMYYRRSGDAVSVFLVDSADRGNSWSAPLTLAGPFSWSALTFKTDATPFGPYEDLTALPDGYGAAFTVGTGSRTSSNQEDVVFVRLTDR